MGRNVCDTRRSHVSIYQMSWKIIVNFSRPKCFWTDFRNQRSVKFRKIEDKIIFTVKFFIQFENCLFFAFRWTKDCGNSVLKIRKMFHNVANLSLAQRKSTLFD